MTNVFFKGGQIQDTVKAVQMNYLAHLNYFLRLELKSIVNLKNYRRSNVKFV